jgi:hypothetical protein
MPTLIIKDVFILFPLSLDMSIETPKLRASITNHFSDCRFSFQATLTRFGLEFEKIE